MNTIALSKLRVWPGNPRKTINRLDLTDLSNSLRERGMLVPLIVRPLPKKSGKVTHEVIEGQRRFLAAELAELTEVPVIVSELDDASALEVAIAANAQRSDTPPLEEAAAIERLVNEHGRRPDQVADKLGRTITWVTQRLRLLNLCEDARSMLASEFITLRHANIIAALDVQSQIAVLSGYNESNPVPSAKRFATEVRWKLRRLSNAPFDTSDNRLSPCPCNECPKRSGKQLDLFDAVADEADSCLDAKCWDTKIEQNWELAAKSAKKKKLTVIQDASTVLDRHGHVKYGSPYTPEHAVSDSFELEPVAIVRTSRGEVLKLYDADAVERKELERVEAEGETELEEEDEPETDVAHNKTTMSNGPNPREVREKRMEAIRGVLRQRIDENQGRVARAILSIDQRAYGQDLRQAVAHRGYEGRLSEATESDALAILLEWVCLIEIQDGLRWENQPSDEDSTKELIQSLDLEGAQ